MQRFVISALVIVTMCAIGLRTRPEDFAVLWKRWRVLLLALSVNLIVIPPVAMLLLARLGLPEEEAVGLLLCAASPGGPAGALFVMQALVR